MSCHDLCVDLAGRQVLRDVTLDVYPGEILGIVGPNGAGKTTLLRAILGVVPTRSGVVRLDNSQSPTRGALGYVPQRHQADWSYPLSIEQSVMNARSSTLPWWRSPQQADHDAVHTALRTVDLASLASRPIGELSGGQRQRVLIARALARGARTLLLDEPFTGVDMRTQETLSALIVQMRSAGTGVVVVNHDLPHTIAMADRLCLLSGRAVACGPPESLTDMGVWAETFGVGADSPMLAGVAATLASCAPAPCVPAPHATRARPAAPLPEQEGAPC